MWQHPPDVGDMMVGYMEHVMVFGMGHSWMLLDDIYDSWMAWMIWDIR